MAARKRQSFWFPLLGLGFAITGADKVLEVRGYEKMFARWGWSREVLRIVGWAEFLGGVLVATRGQRRRGGMLLTTASTAVLTKELEHEETDLAVPRLGLLLAALSALLL